MVQLEDYRISSARSSSIYYDVALSPYLWHMPPKKGNIFAVSGTGSVYICAQAEKSVHYSTLMQFITALFYIP